MEEVTANRLILVIENNVEHVRIIRQVLAENSLRCKIVAVVDGTEALNYLHRKEEYANALRPDLILLDLNLPGKDGRDLLAEIKADPQLKRIPVIVLTTSTKEADVFRTYLLQGNCYVIKSFELQQLSQVIKRIEEFWLEIVTLPVE